MKTKLTCKLNDDDAIYFICPILESNKIGKLVLYREKNILLLDSIYGEKFFCVVHFGRFKYLRRLLGMIRNGIKTDIYIGLYEIPHGLIAITASILSNKPVIVSIIGNPAIRLRNKGLRGLITNWIYDKADCITVTGNSSREYLIDNKGIGNDKIFVLPNSIPLDEFYDNDIERDYDLITLGRLSKEKGLFKLIDIVSELKTVFPRVKVGIAGKGPMFQTLKERIGELGLRENIDLLGFVASAGEFLNRGKIFVTTSFTEGMPRTVIQALACGTPVIATDVGDMSDLVIDGETGIIIDKTNGKDSFLNGIKTLLSDEKLRNKYARNGIRHVRKNYSHSVATIVWERMFNYLESKEKNR